LDLGRPDHVELLFRRSPRGRKAGTPAGGDFKSAIDRDNNGVSINAFYKHSRIKQYVRHEAHRHIPDSIGRNLEEHSWV
jgi:hypothetical protein